MDRVPLLIPVGGPLAGNRYQIPEGDGIYIGRSDECEIAIPDPEVSRQHAKVTLHNAGIWVQDAGSRNGVFINEKRVVRPTELKPGAKLTVGDHEFTLELAEVDEDDPSVIRPVAGTPLSKSSQKAFVPVIGILLLIGIVAFLMLRS